MVDGRLASSFRDPSGFIFVREGVLFRQVNKTYEVEFRFLESSGLYEELAENGLIVAHETASLEDPLSSDAALIIRPERVDFISYPYEWSFSQLKDAALLTLAIQKKTLAHGMSLKDASAYNVQFKSGKPIFIDTLSFEILAESQPWVGYRQFCQHFLAPLALMSYVDPELSNLARYHIDGIPLDLASKLLPFRTRLKMGLLLHIHIHARAQAKFTEVKAGTTSKSMTQNALVHLIESLESTISGLVYKPVGTVWYDYYDATNYSEGARSDKARLVEDMIDLIQPRPTTLWDLGANTGEFSRIPSKKGIFTLACDMDSAAVEKNYLGLKATPDPFLFPLVQNFSNPSPGLGWANRERESLADRGPADVLMALALIHHLAIGNNVPFSDIASWFASIGSWLIIEFVPKEDSQTQRLLQSREDVFDRYSQQDFEREFSAWFDLVKKEPIKDSLRTLYLFKGLPQ